MNKLYNCLMPGIYVRSNNLVKFFLRFRVAADALRILLARAQLDEVTKRLDEENAWDAIKEENTHITGVTLLARYTHLTGLTEIVISVRTSHRINAV